MGWKDLLKGKKNPEAEYREKLKAEILAESKEEIKAELKKEIIAEEVAKFSGKDKQDKFKNYMNTMATAFGGEKKDDNDDKVSKMLGGSKKDNSDGDDKVSKILGTGVKDKKKKEKQNKLVDDDDNYFGNRLNRII